MVSERALREIYLKGFEIAVRSSKPAAVMTSYNLLNGVHTSERDDLMRRHPMMLPYSELSEEEKEKDAYAWEMLAGVAARSAKTDVSGL